MRKVKCKVCGKESARDVAYKVNNGKVNSYYCNKEEYDNLIKKKKEKEDCLLCVQQILKLPLLPPMIKKEINRVNQIFDYIVIQKTFEECESKISRFLESNNDGLNYPKARYIITIVENSIDTIFKKYKYEQEQIKKLFETQKNNKIEVDLFSMSNKTTATSKVTDISEFLD